MPIATGVTLDHVARETSDVRRFINFYQELFGFEEIASFDTGSGRVIWLHLPGVFTLHVIEKGSKDSKPFSPPPNIAGFMDIPCAHHFCFTVSNYDSFVQTLNDKGIQTFLSGRPQATDKVKRTFFFDPDGNLLEAASPPVDDDE
ncbi:Lactoylglutathione lyase / glyoxalase I family protein [Melia azedarach]|uniref:Lactoylglutathione lyase / glyoxalase I family protein n=1 Tax=Melia azedarach TaxID=155640 RepID=A0ACC1YH97_MELAZ|nr:Lactoylglutathione lyase / glyoxalase I family protein [Melia azedarach]